MRTDRRIKISSLALISLAVFSLIALSMRGGGSSSRIETLFSVSSFLFGIFVAFAITNSYSRFSRLSETLKSDEGNLLFVAKAIGVFGESAGQEIKRLIDDYLVSQIDYFLVDFEYSSPSFYRLLQGAIDLKPENSVQGAAYDKILDSLKDSAKNRKLIESLAKQPMLKFEWVSLSTLLIIILSCIFYLNDGSLFSIISSVLLSTATAILIFVLRDLDNLRWKEEGWIWQDLENLFNELGTVPYYPQPALDQGRAKPKKGQRIRVADYPRPYPDMTGKTVKMVEV